MKIHTITWYESIDSKLFTDEFECIMHDINILYKNSGVVFYKNKKKIEYLEDDNTYNYMTDVYIDRDKAASNKRFRNAVEYGLGWSLVIEALDGDGTHYKLTDKAVKIE